MGLSSRSRGEIAVLKVQLRAYEKDLIASIPTNNEIYYDLIIDDPNDSNFLKRVQVKYCNRKSKNGNLQLRLDNKKSKRIFYKKTDIDWILVFMPLKKIILKYEKQYFHRKKTIEINLRNKSSKYYYENFIW